MSFGLPYMGSKSKVAKFILNKLPAAKNFYDLFGGGCAVTHCAALHFKHKWNGFHFNEIKKGQTQFIQDAIAGKYNYKNFKPKWVSREDFFATDDPYVKIIWSFGNGGRTYMFSEENERLKKSLHNAVVFNEFDDVAKQYIGHDHFHTDDITKRRLSLKIVDKSNQLQQLERLEQLEQLERLQQLDSISFYNTSYESVPIKEESIIYCDPPYIGTAKYDDKGFNHQAFYEWVRTNKHPVYFSEYKAPADFKTAMVIAHRSTLSADANNKVYEKVFCNNIGYELLRSKANG